MTGWELVIPYSPSLAVDAPVVASVPTSVPTSVPADLPTDLPTAYQPATADIVHPPLATVHTLPLPDVTVPSVAVAPTLDQTPSAPVDTPITDTASSVASAPVPGGLGAAVLVSCGVLGAITARRRQQLRRAKVGSRLAPPSAETELTETVLRSLGSGERIIRLDIAIRAAADELSRVSRAAPFLVPLWNLPEGSTCC